MSRAAFTVALPRPRIEDWPLIWLWPLGLVLMQATFLQVARFEVTLAVIVCHAMQVYLLVRYGVRKPSAGQLLIYLGALGVTLWSGLWSADPVEFLRSMAHVTNLILMIAICMNVRFGRGRPIKGSIVVLCIGASLAALAVIGQSVAFNVYDDLSWTRLLGDFTPPVGLDREPYAPHLLSAVKRANAWYSEPSVAAWFLLFAAGVALAARRLWPIGATFAALLCLAGAIATLTLTGMLGAPLMILAYVLFVKDTRRSKLLWLILGGSGMTVALIVAGDLGILDRLGNYEHPGTSVYFRFTAPFLLVSDALQHHPLGVPVGQTDFIESRAYYVNWENGARTNIDNMLFAIVFHFGLLGIAFNAAYLWRLIKLLVRCRRPAGLLMLGVALALVATGAGWAHHVVLLIGYAIVVGRYIHHRPAATRPEPAPLLGPIPLRRGTLWPHDIWRAARPRAAWQTRGAVP